MWISVKAGVCRKSWFYRRYATIAMAYYISCLRSESLFLLFKLKFIRINYLAAMHCYFKTRKRAKKTKEQNLSNQYLQKQWNRSRINTVSMKKSISTYIFIDLMKISKRLFNSWKQINLNFVVLWPWDLYHEYMTFIQIFWTFFHQNVQMFDRKFRTSFYIWEVGHELGNKIREVLCEDCRIYMQTKEGISRSSYESAGKHL